MASKINIGAAIQLDGEKKFREALKNIRSEQRLLTSEMKVAKTEFADNANSIDALESKHSILTKQITKQTEKMDLYTKAVEDSIEKQQKIADETEKYKNELSKAQNELDDMKKSSNATTDELEKQEKVVSDLEKKVTLSNNAYAKAETATLKYKTSLNTTEAGLNKFNNELDQNEKYLDEAKRSSDGYATSIDNVGRQTKQAAIEADTFGNSLKNNVSSAAVIGGIVALGYALEKVASKTVELGKSAAFYADDMLTLATKTGISTDKLQAYNYMAELTDTSMETIQKTMVKNIKSMTDAQRGTTEYRDAYKRLNVEFEDANGNLKDSETVYWELIDALGEIGNQTERDSLSLTIFGKSAQDLNTLISQGADGVKKFTDEAAEMGAILDTKTLKSLVETSDSIERFSKSTDILKRKVGAELSDELTKGIDKITDSLTESGDQITELAEGGVELLTDSLVWFIDNSDVIIAGLAGISGAMVTAKVVDGVVAGIEAYRTLSTATKAAAASQTALNIVQAANPIGLIVTAVAGVTAALVAYNMVSDDATTETEKLIEKSKELNTTMSENVSNREQNIENIKAEASYMKELSYELDDLNSKESLSADEKYRLNDIVNQLNTSMPELNLSIDSQTGKLVGNTKAINDSITANLAWYKVQGAREELTALMEEQADAEFEIYKIDQEILEQNQKLADSQDKVTEAYDAYTEAGGDGLDVQNALNYAYAEMDETTIETEKAIEDLNEQKQELNNTESDQLEQVELLNGFIAENTTLTEENADAVGNSAEAYTVYGDTVTNATDEIKTSLDALNESFGEAKESAEDSLESQIGLFEEAEEQSTISVERMAENLASQTEAFNQYKDDLLTASDLVEQGLMDEGLLGYIESFGIDGAGYLNSLVTAAETDTNNFNAVMEQWATMQDAKDGLSDSMAELETQYSDGMENMGAILDDGGEGLVDSTSSSVRLVDDELAPLPGIFSEVGASSIFDLESQLSAGSQGVVDVTNNMVTGSMNSLTAGVAGVGTTAGNTVVNDFSSSIRGGTGMVASAFQSMISGAISSADYSGITSQINQALGDAL